MLTQPTALRIRSPFETRLQPRRPTMAPKGVNWTVERFQHLGPDILLTASEQSLNVSRAYFTRRFWATLVGVPAVDDGADGL